MWRQACFLRTPAVSGDKERLLWRTQPESLLTTSIRAVLYARYEVISNKDIDIPIGLKSFGSLSFSGTATLMICHPRVSHQSVRAGVSVEDMKIKSGEKRGYVHRSLCTQMELPYTVVLLSSRVSNKPCVFIHPRNLRRRSILTPDTKSIDTGWGRCPSVGPGFVKRTGLLAIKSRAPKPYIVVGDGASYCCTADNVD